MIINYQSFLVNLLITDSINKHSVRISFPGLGEVYKHIISRKI